MRKFAGVVAMSVMLMLAACGGQKPVTKTYTSANNGQKITIPATVSNLTLLSGQGGTGQPESEQYVQEYRETRTVYNQRNDYGGEVLTLDGGSRYGYGPTPSNYCTEKVPYAAPGTGFPTSNPTIWNYSWECYTYDDTSYWDYRPATTGGTTSLTGPNGFSRSWAGGTGGPASSTSAENVAVVAGGQYTMTIPSGGSITVSYYE